MDWRVKIDTVCWVKVSKFAHCVNMEIKIMDYLIVHVLSIQRNLK